MSFPSSIVFLTEAFRCTTVVAIDNCTRLWIAGALGHAALINGVLYVVCLRSQKQVLRVDAWRIVTVVTQIDAIGNRSVKQGPDSPVGTAITINSVSVLVSTTTP